MTTIETQVLLEMARMALEHPGWTATIIATAIGLAVVLRIGFRWKRPKHGPPEQPNRPAKAKLKKAAKPKPKKGR